MWATLIRSRSPSCLWCGAASGENVSASVKVLSHFPSAGGRVIEEVEISGPGTSARVESLRANEHVRSLAVLSASAQRARVRVEADGCPLQHAVSQSGAVPRFPFDIKDGADEWLLVSEREEAVAFVRALREAGADVTIVSSREHRPQEGLTDRQKEIMQAAVEHGYFEVPRRVTLTALAKRLHLAKSTLSETLARGERRVMQEAIA